MFYDPLLVTILTLHTICILVLAAVSWRLAVRLREERAHGSLRSMARGRSIPFGQALPIGQCSEKNASACSNLPV